MFWNYLKNCKILAHGELVVNNKISLNKNSIAQP